MPSQSDGGFEPVLPFDVDGAEFARGFEAGRVWADLADPRPLSSVIAHATNAEMFMRMAEAQRRSVRSRELDDTWIEVEFSEART